MIRWLKKNFTRDMIRPLIYKIFTRGLLALLAVELVHFFAPADWPLSRFSNLTGILTFLFLVGAVIAWLRMDGMHVPQMKLPRVKRKEPPFLTGDVADHIDDDIVKFDDLDPVEQNVCVLLTDLLLAVVCLIFAIVL